MPHTQTSTPPEPRSAAPPGGSPRTWPARGFSTGARWMQPGVEGPQGARSAVQPVETPAAAHTTHASKPVGAVRKCGRCAGSEHPGLCVRVPVRTAVALAGLGLGRGWADTASVAGLRARAIEVVAGIITKSGRKRDLAIASCGRPVVARVGGQVKLVPLPCRDRFCPSCQRTRSRKLALQLRTYLMGRIAHCNVVTLTQPKPRGYDPRDACDSIRDFYRQLTNIKTARGREFHDRFKGGLRSIEVTWATRGDRRSDGTLVPYSGWHAHLHLVLQSHGGDVSYDDMVWLREQWCALTGANSRGQDWSPADDERIYQLCKYVVKPLGLTTSSPERVRLSRQLAEVLHARRLHEAFGEWRGWKQQLHEDTLEVVFLHQGAAHSDPHRTRAVSLADLAEMAQGPRARTLLLWVAPEGPGRRGSPVDGLQAREAYEALRQWAHRETHRARPTPDSGARAGPCKPVLPASEHAQRPVL